MPNWHKYVRWWKDRHVKKFRGRLQVENTANHSVMYDWPSTESQHYQPFVDMKHHYQPAKPQCLTTFLYKSHHFQTFCRHKASLPTFTAHWKVLVQLDALQPGRQVSGALHIQHHFWWGVRHTQHLGRLPPRQVRSMHGGVEAGVAVLTSKQDCWLWDQTKNIK